MQVSLNSVLDSVGSDFARNVERQASMVAGPLDADGDTDGGAAEKTGSKALDIVAQRNPHHAARWMSQGL